MLPPRRVRRPNIVRRLNDGLDAKRQVALVSAPAGFGKTVCVSEWLDGLGGWPVTWLSLDPADDDPGRFFTYFLAALQKVDAGIGREIMPVLKAGNVPPGDVLSAALIDDLLLLQRPILFVLDDFHVIQDESILQVLDTLIGNLPPALNLVLLTREDPPLPLARMRANNQLTEVRAAQLRFSPAEVGEYLAEVLGLKLGEIDVALLAERTEGWIAGLHLAGLSIRDRADPSGFIANLSGSHRFILSYLTEEVLSRQAEEIQHFLLQTSILERLNGELCDAVAGRKGSRELLERLFHANLFLVPLDDEGVWYRYHQLFAGLLRDRLSTIMKEEIPELHRRASRWYSHAGMITEAIRHALAADDYTTAVHLIESHAMDMLMQWHVKTVDGWMRSIPPEWVATSPQANLAFAWMHLMRPDPAKAFPYLERLKEMFAGLHAGDQILPGDPSFQVKWLALQAMLLNAQGNPDESLNLCRRALEIAPPVDSLSSPAEIGENIRIRSMVYQGLASVFQQMGDFSSAMDAFQTLVRLGRQAGNSVTELLGVSGLGLLAIQHGHYRFAFEAVSQGIDRVERSGSLPPISTALFGELGVIHYQWHQLEKAHDNFQRAIQASAMSGFSDAELYYGVILSRLYQIQGDLETASEKIEQAAALMRVEAPAAVREEVLEQQVRIYLALDDLPAAERILAEKGFSFTDALVFPGLKPENGGPPSRPSLPFSMWLPAISALRVLLYRARNRGEREHLGTAVAIAGLLIDDALQSGLVPFALETLLVRAQLHSIMGNESSRADYVQALELGQQEGAISVFLEEGPPVFRALKELLDKDRLGAVPPGYVNKILDAFPAAIPPLAGAGSQDGLIEPLSQRELEILDLIGEGLSNQEIAERLVVTLHTVKKHSSNIYSKLGVGSRTQAVAQARQLGLL